MMDRLAESAQLQQDLILHRVIRVLDEMTSDWDLGYSGGIGPETRLVADLCFESIDVVQFVVAVEQEFHRRDLPFQKLLMVDGRYVDDLTVNDVGRFLSEHISSEAPA